MPFNIRVHYALYINSYDDCYGGVYVKHSHREQRLHIIEFSITLYIYIYLYLYIYVYIYLHTDLILHKFHHTLVNVLIFHLVLCNKPFYKQNRLYVMVAVM